ncbi:MAG TPA: TRAP transporter substrate-binding protein DctP [Xanthobacteraceae bacterium]|nr:TRAP transporter substrate-binding protein DctP [Xanthobacteraceae bacterium]
MTTIVRSCALALFTFLAASAATAEPVKLRLAFFSSDRAAPYQAAIKPFIDAVNADAKGLLDIELYPSGILGKDMAAQAKLVRDGGADLALIIPGYTPDLFPDNAVLELPGLFRDGREATYVFTRLIAQNALRGYRDFVVIGAFATEPETLHGRVPIASSRDLDGRRVRVGNAGEAAAMKALGAIPVPMQMIDIANGLSSTNIDAAIIARAPLGDFGISRVATHHFFMPTSVAPMALVMNRDVFDRLPKQAQAIILKYSGAWTAERFAASYARFDAKVMTQLQADTTRQLVMPSAADAKRIDTAFRLVRNDLVAGNPHYRSLLEAVDNEIQSLR